MPLAAVPGTVSVLIPLFAVYRAQQCSLALAVAQGVEAFARGEAIPQGVQDRGLAHTVDADQIGDLQAAQCNHTSSSSPALRYLSSAAAVSSLDDFRTLSGNARITVG